MSGHRYTRSTNPFEDIDDDVDDETFLKNSRRTVVSGGAAPPPVSHTQDLDDQLQSFRERRRQIEDRTIDSTSKSLSVLRDSEQIGIATAEELIRQREKLERTDRQLDEINATLRFSQKHINGIKSVFSSLKNYVSGGRTSESAPRPMPPSETQTSATRPPDDLDRYNSHPATRLRTQGADARSADGRDFSARLDANLQEMCSNIGRLKGLAHDLSYEIDSQNDLIGNIMDKTDRADVVLNKQNKEIGRLLKK